MNDELRAKMALLGVQEGDVLTPEVVTKNLAVAIWGAPGSGKTHFASSFPDPIFYYDFEHNGREVVAKVSREKLVIVRPFLVPPQGDMQSAKVVVNKFLETYHRDLQQMVLKKVQGTLVIDSATMLWDLIRFAYVQTDPDTGRGKGLARDNYGQPNSMYNALFTEARYRGVNVVAIVRSKDVWAGGERVAGMIEADWMRSTPSHVGVVLQVEAVQAGPPDKQITMRTYAVTKCTPNEALRGRQFGHLDYETLVAHIANPDG